MDVDVINLKKVGNKNKRKVTLSFTKVKDMKKLEKGIETLVSNEKSPWSGDHISYNQNRNYVVNMWGRTTPLMGSKITCYAEYCNTSATIELTATPAIVAHIMEKMAYNEHFNPSEEYKDVMLLMKIQ